MAGGVGTKECPTVPAEIDLPAATSAITGTTTTATTSATPTAAPSAIQSGNTDPPHLPFVQPRDVREVPRAKVAERAGRQEIGAEEGEADTYNYYIDEDEEIEKDRSPDTRSGSELESAFLQFTGQAASKKREDEEKEKARSSMMDKLDLAVRMIENSRV